MHVSDGLGVVLTDRGYGMLYVQLKIYKKLKMAVPQNRRVREVVHCPSKI